MGFKPLTNGTMRASNKYGGNTIGEDDTVLFKTSWDWLMPVVEKIESMEDFRFNMTIEQSFCTVIENHTSNDITATDGNTKIEAVYNAVVEFIKWYRVNCTEEA